MRLRAMAKINLGLDVIRKREDGYHEVRMIMQTIKMYDLLDIRRKETPGIVLSTNLPYVPSDERNLVYKAAKLLMDEFHIQEGISMKDIRRKETPGIVLSTNLPYVPSDERNLVYKAAKLLMDEFHIQEGISMKLSKFIPVAAGMAGGSSDAAAAFVGVNRLFRLGLSQEELMKRAVQVGADVPYCIMRGTALAEGIGEELTPLDPVPECYILIGKPGINVSTKTAYENLNLESISSHPDIDGMMEDIRNRDLKKMTQKMQNVFEPGIMGKYPVIGEIKEFMEKGAL